MFYIHPYSVNVYSSLSLVLRSNSELLMEPLHSLVRWQVMEVQGNLSKSERAQALHILATPGSKRAAKAGQREGEIRKKPRCVPQESDI